MAKRAREQIIGACTTATATRADDTGAITLSVAISRRPHPARLAEQLREPHYYGGTQGLIVQAGPGEAVRVCFSVVPIGDEPTEEQFTLISELLGGHVARMCHSAVDSIRPGAPAQGFPTRTAGGRATTRTLGSNETVFNGVMNALRAPGALTSVPYVESTEEE